MDVLGQIRASIQHHHLIPRGETVVVGVSGGPDSACLFHALMALRAEFGFSLHAAHLNHRLRGADADDDAEFVRRLAAAWEVPCTIDARDVAALSREHKRSLEESAREARYAFLAEVARANRSRTIAVAHNADDQAESVLMHFLRGSGSAGLRGMRHASELPVSPFIRHPSSLTLIRPLLDVPRSDVERYCHAHGLEPRFDASNLDTTFFRNRLRHSLLPLLETYNPNIRQVLRRTGDVIAAEVEVLRAATESAWQAAVKAESNEAVVFRLGAWRRLPPALRRSTLREAVRRLRPSLRNINFVHIDDAASGLQRAATGARFTLPQRLVLVIDYDTFTIADADRAPDLGDWPLLPAECAALRLRAPGVTALPGSDWSLEAELLDRWGQADFANRDRWTACLDADATGLDLAIRPRAAGDRFHAQGMPSPARLANWMTNVKVPRIVRARLPLIVASGAIAWVAGFRVGQPFVVTTNTRRVIRLSFRRWPQR